MAVIGRHTAQIAVLPIASQVRATNSVKRHTCMLARGLCCSFCTSSKVMTSVLVDPVTIVTMSALVGY